MAFSFKMAASLAAAVLILATSQEARVAWALEDDQAMPADDMVPAVTEKPAEQVVVAIPGGTAAGTIMAGLPQICLSCRCCSRSKPATCQMTNCCSSFNCDGRGKCTLVQDKCGCSGCGGHPAPPAI